MWLWLSQQALGTWLMPVPQKSATSHHSHFPSHTSLHLDLPYKPVTYQIGKQIKCIQACTLAPGTSQYKQHFVQGTTSKQFGSDNKNKQECTSAVFLNLCCGMMGSFHKMLTVMSAGGECKGASMSSS